MKIIIDENREVLKETNKIGNDSENKVEVLEFEFPKQYTAFTKYIEFQIKNEKYVDLIENDQYVITRSIAKYGKIKAQVVLRNSLDNDVAVFKSNIFDLKISNSLNATEDVPTEYPTWIDNLTKLKQDLESSESERISNEDERISAEEERQESFTEMQKTVENAASSIKDLKEEYNSNAEKETKKFNDNALEQTKSFNENSGTKLAEYNKTHTDKIKEYDDNHNAKTKAFDDNAATKLSEYNKNDEAKISAYNANDKAKTDAYNANDKAKTDVYNNNTALKEKAYNNNASNKTETFNSNAESKQNEYNQNAENKLTKYNQNAEELINKVEQVQAENEALKAENKLIKEQIPSASVSGNSVHIEDSSNLNFDWKIKGGHRQTTTDGRQLFDNTLKGYGRYGMIAKTIPTGVRLSADIDITASDHIFGLYATINLSNFVGKTVRMKAMFKSNSNLKGKYSIGLCNSNGTNRVLKDNTNVSEKEISFVIPNLETGQEYLGVWFYANFGGTGVAGDYVDYTNVIITINNEDMTYEPYTGGIPSPNPEYPQEIETVGSNVNLFDGELESGSLTNNTGQNYGNAKNTRSKNYLAVEENTTYALSDNINGSFIVHAYDKDKNWLKMIGASNYTGKYIFTTPTQTAYIRFRTNETDLTAKIKLERDSAITPYSPPGMGCVKKDVVNSNLLDFNVEQNSKVTVNSDGTLTINETGGFNLNIDKLQLKAGITYYQKVELISGSISGSNMNNTFLSFTGAGAWISSVNFSQTILNEDTEKTSIWINASAIFNNAVIKIWANTDKSDFVKHQSQTAIMPIQQEMLENDYIADVEHHEWSKLILKGDENWEWNTKKEITQVCQLKFDINIKDGNGYCNYFKYGIAGDVEKFAISQNILFIAINKDRLVEASTSGFKSYLKQQYESGKPVIIYYKLAEPIDLELTSEQKTVREQKLYTYKNITNISLSDELASIDVKYKKDLETEHNKLQNEIDEIKQLLSTTQTSALLLDNMQNDIESEVE